MLEIEKLIERGFLHPGDAAVFVEMIQCLERARPKRVSVQALWRCLGVYKVDLGNSLHAWRDALGVCGVQSHSAQARFSVLVDGRYGAALRLPPVRDFRTNAPSVEKSRTKR